MTTHPYLVTIARSDTRMVHRATCKKALANPGATPSDDFTTGKAASCCKPRPVEIPDVPTPTEPEVPDAPGAHARDFGLAQPETCGARKSYRGDTTAQCELPTGHDGDHREGGRGGRSWSGAKKVPAPAAEQTPKPKRAGRLEVKVRFMRNGKGMPDSQNKLASVAYYHTKDVVAGAERCTTDRLREILAEAGVAAPEAEPWGPVTLSNGVVLEAVAL